MRVVIPGTFDPITLGHVSLIQRTKSIFGSVVIAVGINDTKCSLFTLNERLELIKETFKQEPLIEVKSYDGLLVDFIQDEEIDLVVRGIRNSEDANYEIALNEKNRLLDEYFETVFLPTVSPWHQVSSSFVRELSRYDVERVKKFVPESVYDALKQKLGR